MAETETSAQEKAHEATPRRLERARAEGDVPRSQDAQSFAAYIGLALAVFAGGAWSAVLIGEALMPALATPSALAADLSGPGNGAAIAEMLGLVALGTLPAIAAPAALVLALLIAQGAVVLAPDKVLPKLSRISPIDNAKQKYGLTGLVDFAKSLVKVAAVAGVLYLVLAVQMDEIAASPGLGPRALGWLLGRQTEAILLGLLVVSAAIAAIDILWQRHDFGRRNRMTHQELKEESRQTEGDPQMRAERRERAREVATQKMLHDVPNADVVMVNPTHYAVALAWERAAGTAPRCLAKGVDEIAHRIRERAEAAGVPVHRDPASTRSIHALVEVGQEIRREHYKAVAAAILFAERMRGRARAR